MAPLPSPHSQAPWQYFMPTCVVTQEWTQYTDGTIHCLTGSSLVVKVIHAHYRRLDASERCRALEPLLRACNHTRFSGVFLGALL